MPKSADGREKQIALSAAEFFCRLRVVGEGLQIGALLQGCVDEEINVRWWRRRRLGIVLDQLVTEILVEAEHGGKSGNGRFHIILRVELEQPGLGQIYLRKGQIERRISICSSSVRRPDARPSLACNRLIGNLEQGLRLQRVVKRLVGSENYIFNGRQALAFCAFSCSFAEETRLMVRPKSVRS